MEQIMNMEWFKMNFEPYMKEYKFSYRTFKNGDFGQLEQIAFDSDTIGGEIEFWSSGRKSLFLIDYISGKTLLNCLFLEPSEEEVNEAEFKKAFDKLKTIILENRK